MKINALFITVLHGVNTLQEVQKNLAFATVFKSFWQQLGGIYSKRLRSKSWSRDRFMDESYTEIILNNYG